MEPTFFAKQSDFRKWLEKNHTKQTELLVGFYKVGSGKPSITWSQSVDAALCFGWIDGVRKSRDEFSYTIRFTPRKSISIWSAVNIAKVAELTKLGLMTPVGLAAFEKREESKSKVYSFEQSEIVLGKEFEKIFKTEKTAWEYFRKQAPSYIKAATWWVINAKQEQTKLKRLKELIEASSNLQYIKHLKRADKKK
jgi:uncharacterized protein YdeI (YjbR/CyaY-like superfamily)